MIRTRFAPSPTGELHIGGARTALFAYLFAKSQKGEFLLRIEDTDRERFVPEAAKRIEESLKWLGIHWDNKRPMVQSDRLEVYKKHAFDLVRSGHAYICTCSKEKLAEDREKQEKEGKPPRYEGYCRNEKFNLSDLKEGCYIIRMKMPENKKIKFNDLVRGEIEFDSSLIDDQVILKSDGYPTYHLASVVDDHEMKITHVIRAEEWLSSTPKHLILYEMFDWKAPEFAHLSMILGPDKKKLSKRHGATSVMQYKEEGYLPEAIVNFLAFLGWNPKDERELFNLEELEKEFKIENINKAPAIFDIAKLNSINEFYLRQSIQNTDNRIQRLLKEFGVKDVSTGELELIGRGGYSTLKEAADEILKLRKEPEYDGKILVFKKSTKSNTAKGLELVLEELEDIGEWTSQELQMKLGLVVTRNNLTNGDVFWPVRVALSGEEKSPSPVELAIALGKEESTKRIKRAIKKLG
ncbi:MAG: glutamate--tRNA ligase [Patescibacteria group bacterium]|nr:glutamate--tRNA ligase [Patescibacteria group bacterium]